MNSRYYKIIRKIHLYASLSIVILLLMYIITSYMMIYHDWFQGEGDKQQITKISVQPNEIAEENWTEFRKKHSINGRFTREHFTETGHLIREYAAAGSFYKVTISNDSKMVEISSTEKNLANKIIGLHRWRGYGGPIQYNLYAVLLDIVGISLIIFAITGIILWLNLLKNNKIAWTILISGFVYVSLVIGYLMFV